MKVRSKGRLLLTVILVLTCAVLGAMLAGELLSMLIPGSRLSGEAPTVA